jgi:hypothetical protein
VEEACGREKIADGQCAIPRTGFQGGCDDANQHSSWILRAIIDR